MNEANSIAKTNRFLSHDGINFILRNLQVTYVENLVTSQNQKNRL